MKKKYSWRSQWTAREWNKDVQISKLEERNALKEQKCDVKRKKMSRENEIENRTIRPSGEREGERKVWAMIMRERQCDDKCQLAKKH